MKKTRKFITLFAILFVAIFAVSCCFFAACGKKDDNTDSDSGDVDATVTGVTVAPTMLSLEEGKTGSVTATVTMSDSSTTYSGKYTWESDKESVATVSGTGATATVTAVAEGTANVTVTVEDQSATCAVTVTAAEIVPEVKDVITVATPEEKSYTTAEPAVFENQADLSISRNGTSYSVSGTASVMGETEAEWYATEDVAEGTPYVVLKMSVATGESVYFVNSEKTYENKEGGLNYSAFDGEYLYVVVALSEGADGLYGTNEYKFTFSDETSETYSVSFADVEYPKEDEPLYNEGDYIGGMNLDFSEETTYSWIKTTSVSAEKTDSNNQSYTKTWEHAIAIGASYSEGFMTLVGSKTGDPMSIGDELEGTLNTAGSASSSNGRYFELNFAGYETDYVTIDLSFVANGSSTRGLGITTSVAKPDANSPAFAQSNGTGEENIVNLSYGQEITTASNRLYITCDASVNIYNVDISIYGEAKPEESSENDEQSNSQVILFYSGATYPDCVELIPEKNDDGTNKSISYKSGDDYKYTYNGQSYQPMKLTSSQYVNLTLSENATVEFYVISGDSNTNAQIYVYSGKDVTSGTAVKAFTSDTKASSFSDTFAAGTYTIMRNNKEMELCYIIITPTAEA